MLTYIRAPVFSFFCNVLLCFAFISAILNPPAAHCSQYQIDSGMVNERISSNLNKLIKTKSLKEAIDLLVEIQYDLQKISGKKLKVSEQIAQLQEEMQKQGINLPYQIYDAIHAKIAKSQKKFKHYADIFQDEFDCGYDYELNSNKNFEIPLDIGVGITMCLAAGFVLGVAALPAMGFLATWGATTLAYDVAVVGGGMIASGSCAYAMRKTATMPR